MAHHEHFEKQTNPKIDSHYLEIEKLDKKSAVCLFCKSISCGTGGQEARGITFVPANRADKTPAQKPPQTINLFPKVGYFQAISMSNLKVFLGNLTCQGFDRVTQIKLIRLKLNCYE